MIDGNLATGNRWSRWSVPGEEPALKDLLRDPVVQVMMARDQVGLEDLLALVDRMREIKARRSMDMFRTTQRNQSTFRHLCVTGPGQTAIVAQE